MDIDRLLADDAAQELSSKVWRRRFPSVKDEFSDAALDRAILVRCSPRMARMLGEVAKSKDMSRAQYMRRILLDALLRDAPGDMRESDILLPSDRRWLRGDDG